MFPFLGKAAHCVWVALLFGALALHAQTVPQRNPGPGTLALDAPWRFHPGDAPRWADPAFDDSAWTSLRHDTAWGAQGYPSYTGFAWYRLHLHIAGDGPPLGLLVPSVDDTYAVFFNGRQIGACGGFPPHAQLGNATPGTVFALPGSASQPVSGVLAIRVWKSQLASNDPIGLGGLEAPPIFGSLPALALLTDAVVSSHDHQFVMREMLSTVILIAGLVSGVLFLRGRRDPLYGWLAAYLIADASSALITTLFWFRVSFLELQLVNAIRVTTCTVALWYLLLHVFGMADVPRWRRLTCLLGCLMLALQIIDTVALSFWQFTSALLSWTDAGTTLLYTLLPTYMFVLLYVGLRRHARIALWPLAVAVTAYGFYNLVVEGGNQGRRFTGFTWPQAIDTWTLSLFGYPIGMRSLLDAFFVLALLVTVARLQAAERALRAALEIEIKSAQEIQRVLVPDQLPVLPGFLTAAAYRPASEVGGDFFQILPTPNGGVFVIVGDVSGKGLKAAMMVSLIVGAARTLAEISESPAALLAGINRRLTGRSSVGFTTCLALHLASTGEATMANAGHLAPFLNATELATEGALPLGLDEQITYAESHFPFRPGDRLTLFTDGLLEARSAAGELFGFDRVQALMAGLPSVDEMMQQAASFGQEDDITLLTVTRTA